jgi:AcrR family transcriptional regulator
VGIAERKERERAGVRARILDAARRIVFADGAHGLTMRKIAEAIEYSPATLYQYFANREAIVRELCLAGFGELLAALAPAARIADPLERLAALGHAYVRFGLEQSETYRLIFMEDAAITTALYGRIEEPGGAGTLSFDALAGIFAELKAAGRLEEDADVTVLAETLWAAVHGIVSLKLTCPHFPATPAETLTDAMLATLVHGLPLRHARSGGRRPAAKRRA